MRSETLETLEQIRREVRAGRWRLGDNQASYSAILNALPSDDRQIVLAALKSIANVDVGQRQPFTQAPNERVAAAVLGLDTRDYRDAKGLMQKVQDEQLTEALVSRLGGPDKAPDVDAPATLREQVEAAYDVITGADE